MTEHDYQGGKPELNTKHDPERQQRLEAEIACGIEEAVNERRSMDHRTARLIAEQLHGQDGPLQTLAATGEVILDREDEDGITYPLGAATELYSLVGAVPHRQAWLEALSGYLLSREEDPGPIRGWRKLTSSSEERALGDRSPMIYVVSLEDYRRGWPNGWWIEADQDPDELEAAIDRVLADSPVPGAHNWEVHDWEGFGELDPSSFASVAELSAVSLGIAEHGHPFAAYISLYGSDAETCNRFERSYLGRWHSAIDYAKHFAEELGWRGQLDGVPECLRDFVTLDWVRLAAYLEGEIDVVPAPNGMVYLFGSD
jgi:antirestriction protein